LDLNLNLGSVNISSNGMQLQSESSNPASSGLGRCRRCLSSSHPRSSCNAPIKCNTCLGWAISPPIAMLSGKLFSLV
jgi:hypothetical protein